MAQSNQSPDDANNDDIEFMLIEGERVKSYRAENASAATLLSLPLEETSLNIGAIMKDLIDDRQIDDLDDAVLLNASVTRNRSHSDISLNYNIRGLP